MGNIMQTIFNSTFDRIQSTLNFLISFLFTRILMLDPKKLRKNSGIKNNHYVGETEKLLNIDNQEEPDIFTDQEI